MGNANGIYQRKDKRWEARYKKGIGDGTVIMAQANIGAAEIGSGCIIAPGCNISSDTVVSQY